MLEFIYSVSLLTNVHAVILYIGLTPFSLAVAVTQTSHEKASPAISAMRFHAGGDENQN